MNVSTAASILHALARTWKICPAPSLPQRGVVAFWHGDMLPVWMGFARLKPVALVSQSRDGAVLAAFLERLGYCCVRGSSSRGGQHALAELIDYARQGRLVLITPDGPRGPRGVAKRGAFICAQQAGVPLYWCTVECRWAIRSRRSWDHFRVPLPFARAQLFLSEPIEIPPTFSELDIEHIRCTLQERYAPGD